MFKSFGIRKKILLNLFAFSLITAGAIELSFWLSWKNSVHLKMKEEISNYDKLYRSTLHWKQELLIPMSRVVSVDSATMYRMKCYVKAEFYQKYRCLQKYASDEFLEDHPHLDWKSISQNPDLIARLLLDLQQQFDRMTNLSYNQLTTASLKSEYLNYYHGSQIIYEKHSGRLSGKTHRNLIKKSSNERKSYTGIELYNERPIVFRTIPVFMPHKYLIAEIGFDLKYVMEQMKITSNSENIIFIGINNTTFSTNPNFDNNLIDPHVFKEDYSFHQDTSYFHLPVRNFDNEVIGKLVIIQNTKEYYNAFLQQLINSSALLILSTLLFMLIMSWALHRIIIKPLTALSEFSGEIDTGNLDLRIAIPNTDEFGKLSHSMNNMLENIHIAYSRLSDEMELSKRIQLAMVPKTFAVEGLDIYGDMICASEVGGDFFDIIQHDQRTVIPFGDVTDHGVDSGLFMMMILTCLRALVAQQCQQDSAKKIPTEVHLKSLLLATNDALNTNKKQLDSRRSTTLTILEYLDNGRFCVSGWHDEDFYILRQDGTLESFATRSLGMQIGRKRNITKKIRAAELLLHSGEVLFLYTDGITEAENHGGDLLGDARLADIFTTACQSTNSAAQIYQLISTAVNDFIDGRALLDDQTMLIIKRC
jgi:serine phosphatase RsbU (regulator of sigma subunit)